MYKLSPWQLLIIKVFGFLACIYLSLSVGGFLPEIQKIITGKSTTKVQATNHKEVSTYLYVIRVPVQQLAEDPKRDKHGMLK